MSDGDAQRPSSPTMLCAACPLEVTISPGARWEEPLTSTFLRTFCAGEEMEQLNTQRPFASKTLFVPENSL